MKLTLTCEHGTRVVELDEGREGVGLNEYARPRLAALMPRCPYCEFLWAPQVRMGEPEA